MNNFEDDIGQYIVRMDALIGEGYLGKNFKCFKKDHPEEEYCARYFNKFLNYSGNTERNQIIKGLKRSLELFSKINNENLVQICDIIEKEDHLIAITELCQHNLQSEFMDKISSGQWYTQIEQIRIIRQILNGANALFNNNTIHKTIKPQNIFIKIIKVGNVEYKIYKIFNSGFCERLEDLYKFEKHPRIGTITHAAPEIINQSKSNAKCEIYSYGILFYQIVCEGKLPYKSTQYYEEVPKFIQAIKANPFKFSSSIQGKYGPILTQLIEQMIVYRVEDRMDFEELFKHEIYTETFEVFEESFNETKYEEQLSIPTAQQGINNSNKQYKTQPLEKIFMIQEIFFRKFLLCQHVNQFLEQTNVLKSLKTRVLQLLICAIGLKQITFAFAICHMIFCDFHDIFKNYDKNNLLDLMEVFKQYCDKSNNDKRYLLQQQKIKSGYYNFNALLSQQFDQLLSQIQKDQAQDQFINTLYEVLVTQKVSINTLCQELQLKMNQFNQESWYNALPGLVKDDIQKICQIEERQFNILYYQLIELDHIIKI